MLKENNNLKYLVIANQIVVSQYFSQNQLESLNKIQSKTKICLKMSETYPHSKELRGPAQPSDFGIHCHVSHQAFADLDVDAERLRS